MKTTAAEQAVRALEDEGARWTFGIPGTHTLELYDALARSRQVRPILVTNEQSASFMADGASRCSTAVGVLALVPGAGVTHSLSGVAEAFMDNVPLVVLACGVRRDSGRAYQLHDVDQGAMLAPVTKAVLRPGEPAQVYAAVRRAFALARSGCPGPVAVEIPADFYLPGRAAEPAPYAPDFPAPRSPSQEELRTAAELLSGSRRTLLYAGNGARADWPLLVELAERLSAPAATTIQGKGVFPESHPLWLWNGFGLAAPAFAREIAASCDCVLAVACRFGEVATGSYGLKVPEKLIHVDIDPAVLNRNYPARLAVAADAGEFLRALLPLVKARPRDHGLEAEIAAGHARTREEMGAPSAPGHVSPAAFFSALQEAAGPEATYVADSGNGAFLAMEHLRIQEPGRFIAPVDFSCMGYAVPAAIGAKLARPDRAVVALPGDGAFLMTALELLTAGVQGAAPVVCVVRDRKLGQIAQFQDATVGRESCADLAPYDLQALARAVGCAYLQLAADGEAPVILREALGLAAKGLPVVVEVLLDVSRRTYFTRGVIAANFGRLTVGEKLSAAAKLVGRRFIPGLR